MQEQINASKAGKEAQVILDKIANVANCHAIQVIYAQGEGTWFSCCHPALGTTYETLVTSPQTVYLLIKRLNAKGYALLNRHYEFLITD